MKKILIALPMIMIAATAIASPHNVVPPKPTGDGNGPYHCHEQGDNKVSCVGWINGKYSRIITECNELKCGSK
ncbi:MAG: hypothetical protein FWF34_01830 [Alphaproteobacteria bacterium]|nr:hypothetical protein [Alphaproteobacteria bacterium]MCL2889973.1 hypothetical protein [Alphaproteobacteria bacterium]